MMVMIMMVIMWRRWTNPYRNLRHSASKAKYGDQRYKQNF